MSKSSTAVHSRGTSIAGLLGVAFVVLKLTGVITWSWWWITAPFWGGTVIVLAIVAAVAVFGLGAFAVCAILDAHTNRKFQRNKKQLRNAK